MWVSQGVRWVSDTSIQTDLGSGAGEWQVQKCLSRWSCVLTEAELSWAASLTCSMTPTALLWLSNRAGDGGAGSSASVDILSRTVPATRVLHTENKIICPCPQKSSAIIKIFSIKFTWNITHSYLHTSLRRTICLMIDQPLNGFINRGNYCYSSILQHIFSFFVTFMLTKMCCLW